MSSIAYLTNTSQFSGVGQRAFNIKQRLDPAVVGEIEEYQLDGQAGTLQRQGETVDTLMPWPGMLERKSVNWLRLGRRLARRSKPEDHSLWHLTNQTLSWLAKRLEPSLVTVHDIIEVLEPQDTRAALLNRYLYSGIASATRVICVSNYTKQSVLERYELEEDTLTVIHNGIGPEYHPIPSFSETVAYQALQHELKLPPAAKVVLYVGSDHPRKNVVTAVRAFAAVAKQLPGPAVFIKVGEAGISAGREALLTEITRLKIRDQVRFTGFVTTERLNELLNLAQVLIFPSRFEGFGLPPLAAMAAGTPVVTSNATSLPEVVGQAGLLHDPTDVQGFSHSLLKVLTDEKQARALMQAGLVRAKEFSWEQAAREVGKIYQELTALDR